MDPTHDPTAPGPSSLLVTSWQGDSFLPRAFLALGLTPLLALVLPAEAVFYISRSLGLALVLFALVPAPRFERSEETLFWRDFTLALGFWLLSRTVEAIVPNPASTLLDLLIESLLGAHYISFVLALEHKPHHPERRRGGLEGTLVSPTVGVFITGIFLFFVLIPLAVATQITAQASFYFYFTLDAYLLLRLLYLRFQARHTVRWHLFYSLLAAGMALILLGDFDSFRQNLNLELVFLPSFLSVILWISPFFPFLFLARLRHAQQLPNTPTVEARTQPTTSLETVMAALAFPLIHILGSVAGLLDEESKMQREVVVLIWLFLLGILAMGQHRLANRRARDLARRKALTAAALVKNQTSLRLLHERKQAQRRLHDVELRCATIFRASPSGLLICDLADGRIREVNQNFEKISGRPREVLLQQTIPQLNLWPHKEQHAQMVQRLEQGDPIHNETMDLVLTPLETCQVQLSAEILQTEGLPAMLCVLRRSPLRANSPSRWLEFTDLSVVGIDFQGQICLFSRGAERLFGVSAQEALGQPLHEVTEKLSTPTLAQQGGTEDGAEDTHALAQVTPKAFLEQSAKRRGAAGPSQETLFLTLPMAPPSEAPH